MLPDADDQRWDRNGRREQRQEYASRAEGCVHRPCVRRSLLLAGGIESAAILGIVDAIRSVVVVVFDQDAIALEVPAIVGAVGPRDPLGGTAMDPVTFEDHRHPGVEQIWRSALADNVDKHIVERDVKGVNSSPATMIASFPSASAIGDPSSWKRLSPCSWRSPPQYRPRGKTDCW